MSDRDYNPNEWQREDTVALLCALGVGAGVMLAVICVLMWLSR